MTSPDKDTKNSSIPDETRTPVRQRVRSTLGDTRCAWRIPLRTRLAQLGTAVAAVGILGVLVGQPAPAPGNPRSAPENEEHLAAESAPSAPAARSARSAQVPPIADSAPKAVPTHPVDAWINPVDAWINEAVHILERHGYSADQLDRASMRTIIMHESGGNPAAYNGWDSNAAAGTPSKGLMQTIEPTFESYALPGHTDIWHPVDNIVAATRYSIDRYGSVSDVPGVSGLRSGSGYQGY